MEPELDAIFSAFQRVYEVGSLAPVESYMDDDIVLDWSASIGPYRGVYRGRREARKFLQTFVESFAAARWETFDPLRIGKQVAIGSRIHIRGDASGVETRGTGGQVWTIDGGRVTEITLRQSRSEAVRLMRARALEAARLYFVCDALDSGERLLAVASAALDGGADIAQLRERDTDPADLSRAGAALEGASHRRGALFFVNDDPALAARLAADGVHVGQDDLGVSEARALAGADALVGLSTHSPEQLRAACSAQGDDRPDYISVGPVWETPTKPGRPAAGLDYVQHAAANATLPWFAIGGIDPANIGEVVAAGAERVVVVRAIRDAADPGAAAAALREAVVKSS